MWSEVIYLQFLMEYWNLTQPLYAHKRGPARLQRKTWTWNALGARSLSDCVDLHPGGGGPCLKHDYIIEVRKIDMEDGTKLNGICYDDIILWLLQGYPWYVVSNGYLYS